MYLSLCMTQVMTGRTLHLGSSHLVPVEMVWPPQVFTYHPGWEKQAQRRILAADLPPGTLDVKGGRTLGETVPRYRKMSRNLMTWRAAHPYPLARAVILLGGNDFIALTEKYLKDPKVPRRKCRTLIANSDVLQERARKIATDLIALRGLLLQYIPDVYVCTILPRAVPTTITYDDTNQHHQSAPGRWNSPGETDPTPLSRSFWSHQCRLHRVILVLHETHWT